MIASDAFSRRAFGSLYPGSTEFPVTLSPKEVDEAYLGVLAVLCSNHGVKFASPPVELCLCACSLAA
jgi:hypothetical protein